MFKLGSIIIVLILLSFCSNKNKLALNDNVVDNAAKTYYWVTTGDQSQLLTKQSFILKTGEVNNALSVIDIDTATKYQIVDGFGYTLTGGSAYLINQMESNAKASLLNELFGSNENAIGVNYLRISIGASDLSSTVFSYNDLPAGQTDTLLNEFSLSADTIDLIPILQKIVAINPAIKIMATPWSPPIWMKDNLNSIGGSLLSKYFHVYANYFVKYLQQMKLKGISIDAITIQNEPQHGGNNPSMLMSANQQADFIKNHLGPLFEKNGIKTKIVIWDHNCDNPNYPISILNDLAAKKYIDGSAFHLYNGDISALSTVYNAHPDKSLYFTEQWTGKNGTFDGDLKWHIKNVIIGSMRNHSKNALEWNLANDPSFGPRTPGGCTECKGALTIAGSTVSKNVAFYIIAHASKFIPSGSIRIGSGIVGNLFSAAFLTPDGKKVVIVLNNGNQEEQFNLRINKRWLSSSLKGGAVATFVI
ncbi:glycoside hydrolase family 30 beta sandwich domain-containing protein [Sediminibacterium sp.]|uniref:glycoside hydrolase family 30 protein n=1 Tax=Sediminibacterium sp. TaxID=1917865 RepID=UPI000BD4DEA5|nr:glycoside hydrolase family 30 beta sandwich domain-containing protein [Sediminibacterium sp.]MDP3392555.1 glycoside hydrolase family 30 beta sandwich domain-containing protein [Sediminibacterium sp.]MDP3565821.1 glycoside hydrolase family 30 beta sandwich domain-containing protein [Sediminibacterium sp.]OYZ01027.1 MAG: glucosylceramidase [Sphingobacteriia bacterium 28-36-52]